MGDERMKRCAVLPFTSDRSNHLQIDFALLEALGSWFHCSASGSNDQPSF